MNKNDIPHQQEGGQSNTTSEYEFKKEDDRDKIFAEARSRLMNVNNWESIAGIASADFKLFDKEGTAVEREVKKEDYFRIDIPGPGSKTGEGYDWVKVEDITEKDEGEVQRVCITVRPASDPHNSDSDTAHFFDENATSTFIIEKDNEKLTAAVFGRNEKPNTEVSRGTDAARNIAVAATAITFFSKIQWKMLVSGLTKF